MTWNYRCPWLCYNHIRELVRHHETEEKEQLSHLDPLNGRLTLQWHGPTSPVISCLAYRSGTRKQRIPCLSLKIQFSVVPTVDVSSWSAYPHTCSPWGPRPGPAVSWPWLSLFPHSWTLQLHSQPLALAAPDATSLQHWSCCRLSAHFQNLGSLPRHLHLEWFYKAYIHI